MESRLNDMRIFGMPVQFVTVIAISLALTIYFGAWAADARIDARGGQGAVQTAQQFNFGSTSSVTSGAGLSSSLGQGTGGDTPANGTTAEGQTWEKMFLFACPLH